MSLKTGELIQNELLRGKKRRGGGGRKKKKINISYFLFLCLKADRGAVCANAVNPIKIKLITKGKHTSTNGSGKIRSTGAER